MKTLKVCFFAVIMTFLVSVNFSAAAIPNLICLEDGNADSPLILVKYIERSGSVRITIDPYSDGKYSYTLKENEYVLENLDGTNYKFSDLINGTLLSCSIDRTVHPSPAGSVSN